MDGEIPSGNLAFDSAGDIYGSTATGGAFGEGVAFELIPSDGGWTEHILHIFGHLTDGASPSSGAVLDGAGNVYGATFQGGTGDAGTIYQLTSSNGTWVENVLFNFDGSNGTGPYGNLAIDASGNLYGSTLSGEQQYDGVVFRLSPSGGGFTYSVLYSFSSLCQSYSGVIRDEAGDFFGGCSGGGAYQAGWIFELTNCSQTCTLVDLHDFSGRDGVEPYGTPALDANGNLYGTAVTGGIGQDICDSGCGVVWEIAGVGAPRKN